ncbi:lipase secretion chaperone [Aeromonas aquatica]|uniref:lipase secretion chaperone n=1 Tax=Aeromonas aquatica TaxID=558964 RepID=UPI00051BF924|nr:lipase secretion chaperone [Aeromonas aquatica]
MNRSVLILALLCPALLLGVLAICPSAEPSLDAAPEQGALRHQLAQRLEQGEAGEGDELMARYQRFLQAEGGLRVPTDPGLASLQLLFDEREQLRQQRFSPAEQEQLFAEDRLMEQWTLRRKALAEASEADKQGLATELELWLAEQPQWFREADTNSQLLGELQTLDRLAPAERDAVLQEKVGQEAVDRLHQLDQSRQAFDQQLAGYLAELTPLSVDDRAMQQQEILAHWFQPEQWRRVEALTRLKLGETP